MSIKKCGRCKQEKPHEEFNLSKRGTFGRHGHCRECQRIVRHEWYLKHQEEEKVKANMPEARERTRKTQFERYWSDHDYREKMLEKNRLRRRQEPAKIRQRANEKARRESNPSYKMRGLLNKRLRTALLFAGGKKKDEIQTLLGCSLPNFISHIESLWQTGMSWDNRGHKGWHIDHVTPCAAFDLTREEEQRKCFHYTNLQPLWWYDNLKKGDRF